MPDLVFRTLSLLRTAALAVLGTATASFAQSADTLPGDAFSLAPNQSVLLKIGRWDPLTESYTAWDTLGGEFVIGPDGILNLPVVGALDVNSRTTAEVSDEIVERVQQQLGLSGYMQAGVTIVDYGTYFVSGDVRAPGAYDYIPGMTVLQAIGQAGGLPGGSSLLMRGDRDAVYSMGRYRVLQLELFRRLATVARLSAELEDRDIVVPDELAEFPMGVQIIQQERQIMISRESAIDASLAQIAELETLLREQISRFDRQLELRDEQLDLLNEELSVAENLVNQGLSRADRLSGLERQVADQQVRRLELETARLNAEQDLNDAARDRLQLINSRELDLVEGLLQQRSAVERLRVEMETEAALYSEALDTGTGLIRSSVDGLPEFNITRVSGGSVEHIAADRDTFIRSGDVIEVVLAQDMGQGVISLGLEGPDAVGLESPTEQGTSDASIGDYGARTAEPAQNEGDEGPGIDQTEPLATE
ncbi:polysaccharide biosynthesis/export family protein [Wenxinia marina]|uniref:Periplasmic protein involved in polysaccharide export n=1 Tax=Wenxinia marina DSM 24838 TaxID=1123501 RepID=A0A0D0QAE4_9RHOB|nr:SLBB domain-containing protein [Wenxinia marina]KIQ69292.1 Periplasmic protein involved in polysaccharide export [Wenxinia marina DSM 24838]GGL71875.1 hypothetical protein GCM10011392_28090 [Wenxinia marina]